MTLRRSAPYAEPRQSIPPTSILQKAFFWPYFASYVV
jgi:hypothetical protein